MKKIYIVAILIIALMGVYYYGTTRSEVDYKANDTKVVTSSKSELDKIMEEESFKKITILRARKVANDSKKDIEVERNKQAISAIESEYESIRAEEIALVGKDGLSLK